MIIKRNKQYTCICDSCKTSIGKSFPNKQDAEKDVWDGYDWSWRTVYNINICPDCNPKIKIFKVFDFYIPSSHRVIFLKALTKKGKVFPFNFVKLKFYTGIEY